MLKTFISYASEDFDQASKLFEALTVLRTDPWMDKKRLIPGDDWEKEIFRTLKGIQIFFVLITPRSYDKRGMLRREIAFALDKRRELLPSDNFIIPIRIDNAPMPDELSNVHWLDWARVDFYFELSKSVTKVANQRGITLAFESSVINGHFVANYSEQDTQVAEFSIDYPYILSHDVDAFTKLNELCSGEARRLALDLRSLAFSWRQETGRLPTDTFLSCRVKVELIDDVFFVYRTGSDTYFSGAAHPNVESNPVTIYRPLLVKCSFDVLFDRNCIEALSTLICDAVNANLRDTSGDNDQVWVAKPSEFIDRIQNRDEDLGIELLKEGFNFSLDRYLPHALRAISFAIVPYRRVLPLLKASEIRNALEQFWLSGT